MTLLKEASTQEIINELQLRVETLYYDRGYRASITTLFFGLAEEVGELAQTMLLTYRDDFTPTARKAGMTVHSIEHEVGDILVYALALCNAVGRNAEWHGERHERT